MSSGRARPYCPLCQRRRDTVKCKTWRRLSTYPHLVQHPTDQTHVCSKCYNNAVSCGKSHKTSPSLPGPVIDPSLFPFMDWMQRGLVVTRSIEGFGNGVFATRDIANMDQDGQFVASLKGTKISIEQFASGHNADYCHDTSPSGEEPYYVDLVDHWAGKINHGPPALANVVFHGCVIQQCKDIKENEQLLVNYQAVYWVFKITNIEMMQWEKQLGKKHALIELFYGSMINELKDYRYLIDLWKPEIGKKGSLKKKAVLLQDCIERALEREKSQT